MKRIILCLLAILSLSVLSMEARTFVLSVGVSRQGTGNNDLPFTGRDAESFKSVMSQHTKDIVLLTSKYATRENILANLKKMASLTTEKDRLYFFFSGHGGPGVICAYDDLITYNEIVSILDNSKSPMNVCFIDACNAGSAVESVTGRASTGKKKNIAFLTGSRPEESSQVGGNIGASYLTQGIIKGLRGKSDANGDKRITLKELFKYCYNDVVTHSNGAQHPQLIASEALQNAALIKWK